MKSFLQERLFERGAGTTGSKRGNSFGFFFPSECCNPELAESSVQKTSATISLPSVSITN